MKTLQEQFNLIQEGKGHKGVFLTEAKRKYPHFIVNKATFKQAEHILKTKNIITEGYVDLMPINTFQRSAKPEWQLDFEKFLTEENKKVKEENVKVESKKISKEVEEIQSHNYDFKDKSNLDNQIGHEIQKGIYYESKQDEAATLEEIKKIVSKNLEKDPLWYKKNAAFGIKGIGYEEAEVYEVSGKHKESGFSDKHKKLVKESLIGGISNLNEYDESTTESSSTLSEEKQIEIKTLLADYGDEAEIELYVNSLFKSIIGGDTSYQEFSQDDFIEDFKNYVADKSLEEKESIGEDDNGKSKDDYDYPPGKEGEDGEEEDSTYADPEVGPQPSDDPDYGYIKNEDDHPSPKEDKTKPKPKKMKKDSLTARLKEIDNQGLIVTMEAKIEAISEEIERRNERLSMIDENSDLAELIDKKRLKEMQRDIKKLEKEKARHEKMYERLAKSPYSKKKIIDENLKKYLAEGKLLKESLDIEKLRFEVDDVASYLEDESLEKEVMDNVLSKNEDDPFQTFGELYAYLDGLLQHPNYAF